MSNASSAPHAITTFYDKKNNKRILIESKCRRYDSVSQEGLQELDSVADTNYNYYDKLSEAVEGKSTVYSLKGKNNQSRHNILYPELADDRRKYSQNSILSRNESIEHKSVSVTGIPYENIRKTANSNINLNNNNNQLRKNTHRESYKTNMNDDNQNNQDYVYNQVLENPNNNVPYSISVPVVQVPVNQSNQQMQQPAYNTQPLVNNLQCNVGYSDLGCANCQIYHKPAITQTVCGLKICNFCANSTGSVAVCNHNIHSHQNNNIPYIMSCPNLQTRVNPHLNNMNFQNPQRVHNLNRFYTPNVIPSADTQYYNQYIPNNQNYHNLNFQTASNMRMVNTPGLMVPVISKNTNSRSEKQSYIQVQLPNNEVVNVPCSLRK